jgi:hypothetical protein
MLKAATLWQPLAGAMALGLKRIETRGRRCNWRGEMAVHAGLHREDVWDFDFPDELHRTIMDATICHEYGAILCVVDLYDCWETDVFGSIPEVILVVRPDLRLSETERALGDYSPGRFALLTRHLRVLRKPVPCRGCQAVPWQVPPEVEAEVRAQLLTVAP